MLRVQDRWLKKKFTDVAVVRGAGIKEGVMISDRVGEIKYISLEKLASEGLTKVDPSTLP